MNKKQYRERLDYNNAYNRSNYRSFSVRFNNSSEKEVIAWLESRESVKGYIEQLIREDMAKQTGKK